MREGASAYAEDMRPVLADVRAEGHATYRAMAEELTRRGILTARGGQWHAATVRNIERRFRADVPALQQGSPTAA